MSLLTATVRRRPRVGGARPLAGPRRDIQGLRAFAVVAVVLDHLVDWPPGGFVGVDVFFVLSGFLITGLLLREHERTGRISFGDFYRRRVKRIVPAATIVIVATVVASWFVFTGSRFGSTVGDAVYALLFAGNWRFALQSTDYFAARTTSPLQQYWSLGVEEQFYLVWPLLLLAVFAVVARRGGTARQARTAVGASLGLVVAVSFAWALYETSAVPDRAYFSTFSRTWELGVGALLAVAAPLLARLPDGLRPALSWTGLVAMVASLFLVTAERAFPAPWAALPVLGTALVVAAGTGVGQQRALWPLTNRVSGYVGDISYSLYLWHFPIVILGRIVLGDGALATLWLVLGIVAMSVYSFHLVEDPVRRSGWLTGRRRGGGGTGQGRGERVTPRQRDGWLSLTTGLAVLLLLALQQSVPDRAVGVPVAAVAGSAAPASPGQALQQQISQALTATTWPETTPPLDEAIGGPQAPDEVLACGTKPELDPEQCAWGPVDAEQTAVLVGDSMSMTYVHTLRTALPDWRVVSLGGFGCTFTDVLIANPDPELQRTCPARKQAALDMVAELEPDLVLVSNTHFPRVPAGARAALSEQEWGASTRRLVEQLVPSAGRVVMLAPPPADVDIAECYTRVSGPPDCVSPVTQEWQDRAATERALAEAVGGTWVDSSAWFCVDGRCPAFVGTTPTKVDVSHMTVAYAERIAPAVVESLRALELV